MVDPLADEARRLRTVEMLSAREIRRRLGIGKDRLSALLRDVPPPEWTKRPNAKDGLRARAVELRAAGRSVPEIAAELGVAKSTAYRWVRHLPLDRDPEVEADRRRALPPDDRRALGGAPGSAGRRPGADGQGDVIRFVEALGVRRSVLRFQTNRQNTGDAYRGCLVVEVPAARRLYWKIEGIMRGMTDEDPREGR